MTLDAVEFLRRFCLHILPRRFVKIRHYGLHSTARRRVLRQLQQDFWIDVSEPKQKKNWKDIHRDHLRYDHDLCPCCCKGKMVGIRRWIPGRSPPMHLIHHVPDKKTMMLFADKICSERDTPAYCLHPVKMTLKNISLAYRKCFFLSLAGIYISKSLS